MYAHFTPEDGDWDLPTLVPTVWTPEGSVPLVVQGRNTVTVPPNAPARFYRLAKP